MSGNQALNINRVVGPQADLAITNHGSDWYFTVCSVMGVTTLIIMGLSFTRPVSHRLFHYITAGITLVACISYWSMGSNLGQVPIQAEFVRPFRRTVAAAGTREIFWVRYVDWFVTTPLLLLDLLLTAALPWPTVMITILADEVMIVCGLVGALTQTTYKWGYWTFGTAAFLFVVYQLLFTARQHAFALGGAVRQTYLVCGVLTIVVWFLYPISWGLSEGGNVIHPDSEAIFYGVLDIVAKPIFGALLLYGHLYIDPEDIGLHIRDPAQTSKASKTSATKTSKTSSAAGAPFVQQSKPQEQGAAGGTADASGTGKAAETPAAPPAVAPPAASTAEPVTTSATEPATKETEGTASV